MADHISSDEGLEEFERLARRQLQREISRVPVPEGRPIGRRAAKRVGAQAPSGRQRLAAVPVVLAALLFLAAIVSANLRPRPESAAQATPGPAADPAADPAAGPRGDWLYLVSAPYGTSAGAPSSQISAAPLSGGGPKYVLSPSKDAVLSPDGSTLYSLGARTLGAYEAATGQRLWEVNLRDVLEYVSGGPPTLAVSPDGATLAVASMLSDPKGSGETRYWIQLIDTATRKRSSTAPGQVMINPINPDTGLSVSPGGTIFTPATAEVTIEYTRTFTPGGGTEQEPGYILGSSRESGMAYQPMGVGALLFSADSRYLYSVAPDAIYAYDLKQRVPVRTFGGPGFDGAAAIAPDGRTLYATSTSVSGGNKLLTLNVIDPASRSWRALPLGVLDDGYNPGNLLALSADGRRLVIGVRTRENASQPWSTMLKVLDVGKDFAEVRRIRTDVMLRPSTLVLDSAGTTAYAAVMGAAQGGDGDSLAAYDLGTGAILPQRDYPQTEITRLLIEPGPAAAPDPAATPAPAPPAERPALESLPPLAPASGTAFVLRRQAGAGASRLTALDLASGLPRFAVAGGTDAALSPDGRWLYVIGEEEIRAVAAASGEERWRSPFSNAMRYKDTGPPVMALAPDGRTIYVLSYDATKAHWIQFVDAETGAVLEETIPLGPLNGLPRLGAAPDGETLYVSTGGRLRFLDLKTRMIEREIGFDFGSDVLPSRDGERLYVIGHRFPSMEITEFDIASRAAVGTLLVPAVNGRSTFFNQIGLAGDGRLALGILNSELERQQLIAVDLAHPDQAALAEPTADGEALRRFVQAAGPDGRSLYLAVSADGSQGGDALVRYDMLNGAGPFERWAFPGEQIARVLIAPAQPATGEEPAPAPPPTALPEIPATATPRP